MSKRKIVLSGANITSGGPLTIFNNALYELSEIPDCEITAIVGDCTPFYKTKTINFIELPNYKKFIFLKFYYEFVFYKKLSKQMNVDVWISLNDFTPNVVAENLFTYFHNASIFFNIKWSDAFFSRRVIFQKIYYKIFLRFNIKKNKKFIVQQDWIAKNIHSLYKLPIEQILEFRPNNSIEHKFDNPLLGKNNERLSDKYILFYPTRAYGYKNIEFICEALKIVLIDSTIKNIELRITINENENNYSRFLRKKYSELPIVWLGVLTREEVESNYLEANALVFPSRLETWGLPLSEFSRYNKPIFAIDLEYVYETLYNYPYLAIFNANDYSKLAELIKQNIRKQDISYFVFEKKLSEDFCNINTWKALLEV